MHPNQLPKEKIACPYCGSTQATTVRHSADIVSCDNCHTVYLRTRLTKDSMYSLYQSYADGDSHMRLPATSEEVKQSGLRREFVVNEIEQMSKHKGVWLDVGCGWGALVDCARDHGYSPLGIELTRKCVDYATMNLGIPVSNSQLLDTTLADQTCSVITMMHVLEHLPYPKASMQKVYSLLQPGGVFCGMVPNFDSLMSELYQEQWSWLDPFYHYVHYTPHTLKARLEEAGFIVENVYTVIGDYGEHEVLDVLQKILPAESSTREHAEQAMRLIESDGRGDEIRFFARKPETEHRAAHLPEASILKGVASKVSSLAFA